LFAEGVVCATEIKSDLSNKKEIERAVRQVKSIKKLERKPTKGELMFGSEYDQERINKYQVLYSLINPLPYLP